jgi:hypothetical protein
MDQHICSIPDREVISVKHGRLGAISEIPFDSIKTFIMSSHVPVHGKGILRYIIIILLLYICTGFLTKIILAISPSHFRLRLLVNLVYL